MIRRLAIWLWSAWPVLVMAVLGYAHWQALTCFPGQIILVHKLTGTAMQLVGGLIILHSVDSNLGLFRNQNLIATVFAWFSACPIFARPNMLSSSISASSSMTASMSATVIRATTTTEEQLAALEGKLEELRLEVTTQQQALSSRIADLELELSNSIGRNQSALRKLSEKLEKATIGGFKQQAFGVLLVIYAAGISFFTC